MQPGSQIYGERRARTCDGGLGLAVPPSRVQGLSPWSLGLGDEVPQKLSPSLTVTQLAVQSTLACSRQIIKCRNSGPSEMRTFRIADLRNSGPKPTEEAEGLKVCYQTRSDIQEW